jgi:SET domain-containing protein
MGVYYDQEIQNGIHPRMTVRWIDEEIGFGLFAAERILPCLYVGEYTGLIQERKTKHIKESNYCVRYTAWPMGKRQYVIDAQNMGNFTRFINHSDSPNISLVCAYWRGLPRLIFISLQEIPKGAQLTFDYGKTFWKQSPGIVKRK